MTTTPRTGRVVGACPLDCPDGCSWVVTVEDGVAVKLQGNREHPFTRGTLCVKVNQYLDHAAAPDRLLHPLRRVGPKGSGEFTKISWGQAIEEISTKFRTVMDTFGGEAIWPYQGTGHLGFLQGLQGRAGSRFWNVLGASHHEMTICSIAGVKGVEYTQGASTGMDPEAFAHAKLILLWGANSLTTGHHFWNFVDQGRKNGAHVVVIDPVVTRTARQADEHVSLLPGTDAALALGILHVVLANGGEDPDFLTEHTLGWDKFRERILQFTPERVAAITQVPVSQIVRLGERVSITRPTAIRAGVGLQRHAGGGAVLRTLSAIPGVTGDWKYPGGGFLYTTDGYFGGNRAALARDDLRQKPVRTLFMTRLADHLINPPGTPVKALFVYGANPVASAPQQDKICTALSREDLFTVVVDHFQTDTADYADIVLPATMQTEHLDVHDGYGHLYVAFNEKAVAPPGECLPTTEIFRRLAAGMKLGEPSLFDSDEQLAGQLLNSDHPSLAGITLTDLRAKGWARLNYPVAFTPFAEGFPTPSNRLEFWSETARNDGLDPMPGYTPPKEVVDEELAVRFPLVLIAGASHFFMNTVFGNKPELLRRAGPPRIVMHPQDAESRGLRDTDLVQIFNDRGSFTAAVAVADTVRPGVVASTKGYWRKLTGQPGVNATVEERDSDMGGGAVFHDNRVQVAAAKENES